MFDSSQKMGGATAPPLPSTDQANQGADDSNCTSGTAASYVEQRNRNEQSSGHETGYPSNTSTSASQPQGAQGNWDTPAVIELRGLRQWVAWRYKEVETPTGKKFTKPPVSPHTGYGASHSNRETWGTYDQARNFAATRKLPGVGFVLSDDDDFTGIDLDDCRNPETGELEPWAQAIIDFGETYAEVSPSGAGLRLIARGKVEVATKSDPAGVEIYGKQRYLTITADHLPGSPTEINPAPKTLDALRARVAEVMAKIEAEKPVTSEPPIKTAPPVVDMFSHMDDGRKPEKKPSISERARKESGSESRYFRNVNDKALERLDVWFPVLFPSAKPQPGTGGWRVSSKDLGRDLEEDISATPGKNGGIMDFGVHDMGDRQGGKRTAISLVMEWGDAPDPVQASFWLCERLGVEPEALGWVDCRLNAEPANDDHAMAGSSGDYSAGSTGATSDAPDPLAGFIFDGQAPQAPPPRLIKGLIGKRDIAFIGGQSGAGKSFIAVDLAVSLASGEPFFGHKVMERVGVAILVGEGQSTIPNRVEVARREKCGGPPLPITWLGSLPDLTQPKELVALANRLKFVDTKFQAEHGVRLGVVIFDTLAATFLLQDENSNSEAARIISQMKWLADTLNLTVMPVHHYGKSKETGLRGASAFRAGSDTVLTVMADRDETTGQCHNRRIILTKTRDGAEGWLAPFTLRGVTLGLDEDGEEYGTCFVQPGVGQTAGADGCGAGGATPRPKLSENAKLYLDALNAVLDKGKKIRPWGAEGSEVHAVDRESVRKEFYSRCMADGDEKAKQDTRKKAFQRGEARAKSAGLVGALEVNGTQFVWLLREDQPPSAP